MKTSDMNTRDHLIVVSFATFSGACEEGQSDEYEKRVRCRARTMLQSDGAERSMTSGKGNRF
jgi:hypothetical protein